MNAETPAGWFPDPQDELQFRYWDGNHWTEHRAPRDPAPTPPVSAVPVQSAASTGTAAPSAPAAVDADPQPKNWFLRHKLLTGALALCAVVGVVLATSGGGGDSSPKAGTTGHHRTSGTSKDGKASKDSKPTPSYTVAQQSAIDSAQSYLDMSGFSRAGLVQQLSSKAGEGFKKPVAVFAVRHLDVDWNQQAVASGKSYLEMGTGFSKAGLVQQLSSSAGEEFTAAQAAFAVKHLDVDWNKQAVESAKGYMQMGGFSRAGLIQQLSSSAGEQFTAAQATYAADHVGL
jgi:hypothetical protein